MTRIDIIHQRDPDYECFHEVYVDGKKVTSGLNVWDFDPGRGYEMDEFEENKQYAVDSAPGFLKPRIAKIYDGMKPTYEKWATS